MSSSTKEIRRSSEEMVSCGADDDPNVENPWALYRISGEYADLLWI